MAITSVNIPLPVSNGAGAAVDTSFLGQEKTIVIAGNFPGATITIEVSEDGSTWAPLITFQGKTQKTMLVMADRMRAVVSGRRPGSVFSGVNIDVAADFVTGVYANLPMPVSGVGAGVAVAVTDMAAFKSVVLSGSFPQSTAVYVQVSQDNTDWADVLGFQSGVNLKSTSVSAAWMRVFVEGTPLSGAVACDVGAEKAGGANPMIGLEFIPECWQQILVPANQAATAMACGVSQIFDNWMALRPGSITGLLLRSDAVLTAGTATAVVTVNGVPTAMTVQLGVGDSAARDTEDEGIIPFSAGDLIGVTLATSAGFLPTVTLNMDAWVEIDVS